LTIVAVISLTLSLGAAAPALTARPITLPVPPIAAFPAPPLPPIDATAWAAYSVAEESVIGGVNIDVQLPQASITKVMTAILTVENAAMTELVTISATAAATGIGYVGQPAVRAGEVWTVGELLENIMVQSGNDAAAALAEHVAGSVPAFVSLMNARAAQLGMASTVFRSPHGLDAEGQVSTARDLVLLGREALRHPEIRRAARIKHVTFAVGGRRIPVTATNRDLGIFPGLFGLKTGDTAAAGQVLLSYAVPARGGVIGVVLGSTNRRAATRGVLAWAAEAYGPRDYLLAPLHGMPDSDAWPGWYRTRLAGIGPLPPGNRDRPASTPLTGDVDARLRELLPRVLGGDA
jgi:serine-type D-Ala-D-Ala carboxypeptidase (penicillin-binding protein 5/6)